MRNTRGHVLPVFFAILFLVLCGTSRGQVGSSQGPIPRRITAPVDDAVRVTIPKSTHPQAQARFDRGPVDPALPMERMILVLGVSPEQEHQARTFLDSQQTTGSPDYHHWLTPEEFGQRFGPSPQDVQQVTSWLQQQGFRLASVAKSGRWVEFSGTAAQVQAVFQTQMRTYQVDGQMHLANASDISIPAALTPVVRGVSLHNFFSKPMHMMGSIVHGAGDGTNPNATLHDSQGNIIHALAPGDFANIYNLNPLYTAGKNGSGQTIAIVARSDIDLGDIADFVSIFGLPGGFPNVITNGPDPGDVPGDDVEATLDVEWSRAVATGANIDLVISSSTATTDGVDLSAAYIVENNLAPVMSVSFNQCEQLLGTLENQFINSLAQQAAAQGISVFVSAGDDGAAACDDPNNSVATGPVSVGGLASPPYVTAVGGTAFNETVNGGTDATYWNSTNSANLVSAKGYIPEMVWNESCSVASCGASNANLFAGSGGVSTIYTLPSWQAGVAGLNFSMRALPDVSLAAAGGHDGYLFCFQRICQGGTSFFVIGGTSASSPAFAGIMAIIDQKIGKQQGLANYVLYPLAQNEASSNCDSSNRTNPLIGTSCVFNDIIEGNNRVPGETGFNALPGFDLASGLGSVDANNLANAWTSIFQGTSTTLAANPSLPATIVHGTPLNFNVSVARMAGTATPSGTVSLIASGGNLLGLVGVAATTISGSGGTATANPAFTGISNLPGGTAYNLVAHYPGDGTFGASDSSPLTVTVMPESSTTALTSIVGFDNQGNPIIGTTIPYGGFLDLRTVVASATNTSPPDGFPSRTITLSDDGSAIGTLKLNTFAQAELINCSTPAPVSPVCLTVGSHPISVSYGGDNGFMISATANPAVTITVTKGNPGVAATAPATANFNTPITVQASVFPTGTIFPSGTVQFFQGTTALGPPLTLAAGNPSTASAQVTLSGTGNQSITVQYSGDTTYNPASSPPSTVIVTPPFNFSATTTSDTIAAGATATYNVTLNAVGGFTGSVSFGCTGAPGGSTCAVSPNPATLGTSVPLTVMVSNTVHARLAPAPFNTWSFVFAGVLAVLLWSVKRKHRPALLMVLAVGLVLSVGSCGGGSKPPPPPPPPTVATLTVTGTSGSVTNSITLSLTVTH